MEHPTYENLLSHLEGAGSAESEEEIAQHLRHCPECAAEFAGWKRTIQRLQTCEGPKPEVTRPSSTDFVVKWAAAAVLVLGLGFGLGRLTYPNNAAIKRAVANELKTELINEVQAVQARQRENERAIFALVNQVRHEHQADYLSLRHDLETAAWMADRDLRQNQQQLNHLTAALFAVDQN